MDANQITNYLRENEADFNEVEEFDAAGVTLVKVSVEWGDWKHSHLRLDHLLKSQGFLLLKEDVTEEDGSDCYSSEHIFYNEKDAALIEAYKQIFKTKD